MHTTNQILDAVSAKHGGVTDYRLSKLFGTSTSAVGNWRAGRTALSQEYALRAAELLEWDPAYVVACVERERAEKLEATDDVKATWDRIANAFKPAAAFAAVILAALLGLTTPSPSKASAHLRARDHAVAIYIMRT